MITPPDDSKIRGKTHRSLVEMVHAQLGLLYHLPLSQSISGTLALGYQLTEYINSSAGHALLDDFHEATSSHFFEDSSSSGPFLSFRLSWL